MKEKLFEIIKLFFYLGIVAFGGPAAHIAMIHREVVSKRKWLVDEHFLDLVGATSLIPGPNSTEMVLHCGFHRAGMAGLILSGVCFILPATIITSLLAYFYVKLSGIPHFESYLVGIRPVVLILIFDALRKLWPKAMKSRELIAIGFIVFVLGLSHLGEIHALFLGSVLGFLYFKFLKLNKKLSVEPFSLFLVFFKIGTVLFGSGYVLIAYIQDEMVVKRGWLTTVQLADAIGIGQFTPGPVLSTATFIGYLLGGGVGAMIATLGIFLPSFLLVYLVSPLILKLRSSQNFSLFLDCINAATIGLMAYALYPLGVVTFKSVVGVMTFLIMLIIYFKFPKLSSFTIVGLGIGLGWGLSLFGNLI